MLFDSNIVIYSTQPDYPQIQTLLDEQDISVSAISCIEVLGYHQLEDLEKAELEAFFQTVVILPVESGVIDVAVGLRQQRKMSLGDAIIAATAISYQKILVTRNITDFKWIEGLSLYNPIDD